VSAEPGLEFLSPGAGRAVARSPMERDARAAGGRLEQRDGWSVAVAYRGAEEERDTCRVAVGFADVSHLGKIEVQAGREDLRAVVAQCVGAELELGRAANAEGAWWCPLTLEQALVICEPGALAPLRDRLESAASGCDGQVSVTDVTTGLGALVLAGPLARETFARFCAIDLRPEITPVGGFRPGSVARTPGMVLREGADRYLMLFGASFGHYVWTVVADAAQSLGGSPVGVDVLESIADLAPEEVVRGA
jgi:heterotetrameric sarcosine oxidase gamma subunit